MHLYRIKRQRCSSYWLKNCHESPDVTRAQEVKNERVHSIIPSTVLYLEFASTNPTQLPLLCFHSESSEEAGTSISSHRTASSGMETGLSCFEATSVVDKCEEWIIQATQNKSCLYFYIPALQVTPLHTNSNWTIFHFRVQ